jgi:hypothetical protein
VKGEEDVEDHLGWDDRFVEVHTSDLGVPGVAIAHGFIARVVYVSTHVANLYVGYTLELHV